MFLKITDFLCPEYDLDLFQDVITSFLGHVLPTRKNVINILLFNQKAKVIQNTLKIGLINKYDLELSFVHTLPT